MFQANKFEVGPYISLVMRRRWWVIVPFVLSLLGGGAFLKVASKSYKANTLILLEPQSIPDAFVRSTVQETMEGRLRTITQQLHSRTNLEAIIKEFQMNRMPSVGTKQATVDALVKYIPFLKREKPTLAQGETDERVLMMRLVDEVRKNLQVVMRGGSLGGGAPGREQSLAFEISFEWNDQDLVAPVTNAVASRFIEENLNAREEIAISTTDFLDKEAAAIRSELERSEKELEAFKKEHMGMLPDQLQSNIAVLNQLRDQLLGLQRALDQEKQQALLLRSQSQMAQMDREALAATIRPDQGRTGAGRRGEPQLTADQLTSGNLEDLERELRRMSSLYTEKHPDIVALKQRINALKMEGKTADTAGASGVSRDGVHDRISLQLVPINANIEAYKNQIREVEKQIQFYKDRIERAPQVEMALNKIVRDHDTIRERYDSLLSKKLDAKLAEQMEKRKKGEQFKVLDPAIRPPKPFKPDALRVMAMVLVLGLGLGGGLGFLREMLDACFYDPREVEAYLDVGVIVSLPTMKATIPH